MRRKSTCWNPGILLYLLSACAAVCLCQSNNSSRILYDDAGRLIKVIDSSGNELDYKYDPAGNLIQITRGTAPGVSALAILNFTPQTGGAGTVVTIQGQNFSATPSSNTVTFNGAAATVLTATATTLTVTVPGAATTGPISLTVAGTTVQSANPFTFIAGPSVLSVSPKSILNGSTATTVANFAVTGANLTGATFSFVPGFFPVPVTVTSATISADGTSATLGLSIAANTIGSFTLVATTASGASSSVATTANTVNILAPDGDADADGLTNAVEIALGTDPLNPTTSGAGLPDGWQVFYGLNPLDPSVAGEDLDNSGLTILQDFQKSLSPLNPNLVPPAVAQITPAKNAADININGVIVVRFAEPLLTGTTLAAAQKALAAAWGPAPVLSLISQQTAAQTLAAYMNRTCCGNSVVAGTVTLTGPDGAIPGSETASNDNLSVTFASSQPLQSNTTFSVTVNGLRDAAGNLMTNPFTSSFTTGSAVEFTHPTVSRVAPENGTQNVPVNVHYTVQFSKTMDPATLTPANLALLDNGKPVSGMVQVDASGTTASFIPDQPLSVREPVVVDLSTGIQDIYGNSLNQAYTYSFTTGDSPEIAPLHVAAVGPAMSSGKVGTNALIHLLFNEPVNLVTATSANIQVTSGGQPVPVMIALSAGDQRATITPVGGLAPNTQYTVTSTAGLTDLAGVALDNPGSFSFTTGSTTDATRATTYAFDPPNNSTGVPLNTLIDVVYTKPVDPTSVTPTGVLLYPPQAGAGFPVEGSLSVSSDGSTVSFGANALLQPETRYCFETSGIQDDEGNAIGSVQSCFTTGVSSATAAPTVVSMSPANGSFGVPLNAAVSIGFSAPMSSASMRQGTFKVSAAGVAVAGSLIPGSDATSVTFVSMNFAPGTTYTVQISGLTDLGGNPVTPFSGAFTTAASGAAINVSTGYDASWNVIVTGGVPDAHWVVTPTATTPAPGTFSVAGNPQPLYISALGQSGFSSAWVADGPLSSWIAINPDSASGNTFGVYSTTFTVPGNSVPPNLCLVGSMGVDDSGQLGINGSAIMNDIGAEGSLSPLNIPVSSYLVPGSNTLSLAWGSTDNNLEGFRLQAIIGTCTAFQPSGSFKVQSVTPAANATSVPVTSPITITFTAPVNPITVSDTSIRITANLGGSVGTQAIAGNYSVNGANVIFTPVSPFPGGVTIGIAVANATVQDFASNTAPGVSQSFSTVVATDTTPPAVLSITPANGATGIGLTGEVVVLFSKSMNPAGLTNNSIAILAAGKPVSYLPSVSADNRTLMLSNLTLPPSTRVTVAIPHTATDLEGNGLADFTSSFTTGPAFDSTHASISNQRPASGATGVRITTSPLVLFSNRSLNAATLSSALHVAQNGQLVNGTIQLVGNGQTIEFTPLAPWQYGATVQVFLDTTALDADGNTMNAYQSQFTTATDPVSTPPTIVNYSPALNAINMPLNTVVDIGYSEPLASSTVNSTNVTLSGPSGKVAVEVHQDPTGTRIIATPSAPLAASTRYCISGANLQGANGLAAPGINYCFTMGTAAQATAPAIVTVSPLDQLIGVPVNANISIAFAGPIDPLSVTEASIQVTGGGQTVTPASLSFSNSNQTVSVTPQAPLPASTQMGLMIGGVTDVAANPVATHTSKFTTGTAPQVTQPTVLAVNPPNNATAVPTNAVMSIQASTALDSTTVNAGSFSLTNRTLGQSVSGNVSQSPDGSMTFFLPASALAAGQSYQLYVNSPACCMTDLAGNSVPSSNYLFTVGSTTGTAPQVAGVSPSNGVSGLPINAQITIAFNEPVDAESLAGVTLTSGGASVPLNMALSAGNQTLVITPAPGLLANTSYTVTVDGITDLSGTPISPAFSATLFTGGEAQLANPALSSVAPANNSTGVATRSAIQIQFNNYMNPLTLNAQTVTLADSAGNAVNGTVALNPAASTMTFTPSSPLASSTKYTLSLAGTILDVTGKNLNPIKTSFTTGP